MRLLPRLLPLRPGEPLEVLLEQDLIGEVAARAIDRRRIAALERLRPFHPRPLLLAQMQRAKQAVVLEPPRLLADVGLKRPAALAAAAPLALEKALDQYRLDTGHYPTTELGLVVLVNRPQNEPKWNGPYLRKDVPLDPWGKAYVYKQPGERGDYDILSFGKDGQPGGAGENADITNH